MTLRTSLFNKGIYKSVLKRFWWGSAFYFVILFMLTGMIILTDENPGRRAYNYYDNAEYLIEWEMLVPGLVVGVVAVTVTAMLVYRFVHSRKQAVFTHSLPVSREANYISTVLGALTLMAAPIILNGVILMIISACGYGKLFNIASCFHWIGKNLTGVFVLFAYSTLAAMLTGNTFAVLVINVVIYIFLPIMAEGVENMLGTFLYGYGESEKVIDLVLMGNPVLWTVLIWGEASYKGSELLLMIYQIFMAFVLYAASFFIYKKRKLESAEEVAAFARLKPVYKYMLTLLGALGSFIVFFEPGEQGKSVELIVSMILVSAAAYFGSEMALKKKLRVWGSYKGYLVFVGIFGAITAFMALTSVFGFEIRVPDMADVESVAIYKRYFQEEPFSHEEVLKEKVIKTHREIVEKHKAKTVWGVGILKEELHIKYKLKNGGTIYRFYDIDMHTESKIGKEIYNSGEYKKAQIGLFNEEVDNFTKILINSGAYELTGHEKGMELLECIRKDVDALDYEQIESDKVTMCDIPVDIYYECRYGFGYTDVKSVEIDINMNFRNTIQWFKDNGYWDYLTLRLNQDLYIFRTWYYTGGNYSPQTEVYYKITVPEDLEKATEFIYSYKPREYDDKMYYSLGWRDETGRYKPIMDIDEDTLPSLLDLLKSEEKLQ